VTRYPQNTSSFLGEYPSIAPIPPGNNPRMFSGNFSGYSQKRYSQKTFLEQSSAFREDIYGGHLQLVPLIVHECLYVTCKNVFYVCMCMYVCICVYIYFFIYTYFLVVGIRLCGYFLSSNLHVLSLDTILNLS